MTIYCNGMESLTGKQQKVLSYIEGRLRRNDPPSQREISRHFGMAQNAAYQLVSYLKKKGYLTNCGGHRGLRLSKAYIDRTKQCEGVPVIGRVAAGTPILAEENIEGYVDLRGLFGKADDVFVLKVAGDSMSEAGIMDGDFVVVRGGAQIGNGRIGVAMVNDEATVKRIHIRRNRIALEPANRAGEYKTMQFKKDDESVRIIGEVTGCFRKI